MPQKAMTICTIVASLTYPVDTSGCVTRYLGDPCDQALPARADHKLPGCEPLTMSQLQLVGESPQETQQTGSAYQSSARRVSFARS